MFEVFEEYFKTKLNTAQRKMLADSSSASSIVHSESRYDESEPTLNIPVEPTFKPENYTAEFKRIDELTKGDTYINAMSLLMYTTNFGVANCNLSKETYEQIFEKYISNCQKLIYLHPYLFQQSQVERIYKIVDTDSLSNEKRILLRLLQFKSLDDKLDISDLNLTRATALFVSEEDMLKRIEENSADYKNFKDYYTDINYPLTHTDLEEYSNRINKLKNNLYNHDVINPAVRDNILFNKFKQPSIYDLRRFIEEILSLDIHFGQLLGPMIESMSTYRSARTLVRDLNDILEERKNSRSYTICSYMKDNKQVNLNLMVLEASKNNIEVTNEDLFNEYEHQHEYDYRYSQVIREMIFAARCCAIGDIPKSAIKAYGNIGSIIKLYNFNWDAIWNACWENKTDW